ncbi:TetR/AcrR family transcriptional regulator [Nocardioides campestrisoli]|uniref:TetR/AcrR family transcriptional regulator n=1 Tax=Nocardioides campestrisoli TaxID=2736757 RepID=UPI0015E6E30E|nr:TetR/AcrR family transcriptional regulator [Nocardioides campestrisoli]
MEQTASLSQPTRRGAAAARRRVRTQEILAATRALFDERGVRDAQIEDIARAVGINRAIVYRHFSGKEELFALTLVGYLDELRGLLDAADDRTAPCTDRLVALVSTFADYGIGHPAFVDCAQSLMGRTGPELLDEVSEETALKLGRAISGCLVVLTTVLDQGRESGEFSVSDPHVLANVLYASALGALQLGRVGILVRELAPGTPATAEISAPQVKDFLVSSAVALAVHGITSHA